MNHRPKSRDIFKMDRTIDKPGKIDFCKLLSMCIATPDCLESSYSARVEQFVITSLQK